MFFEKGLLLSHPSLCAKFGRFGVLVSSVTKTMVDVDLFSMSTTVVFGFSAKTARRGSEPNS